MNINRRNLIKYGTITVVILFLLIYPRQIFQGVAKIFDVAMPLIVGAMFAYALNILVVRLEKYFWPRTKVKILQKSRRLIVILVALIILVLIISLVVCLVLPQFINAITQLFKSMPTMINDMANFAQSINKNSPFADQLKSINLNWSSIQSSFSKFISNGVSGVFSSTFRIITSVAGGVFDFILGLTFAIYILASKEKLTIQFKKVSRAFIKPKYLQRIDYVLKTTNKMFSSFIVGQVTEAFILGTLCTLGMLLFRFPYALSVGAFVCLTALIPIIGAWLGGTVGFFLIAVQSPFKAVLFIVFILVLQEIEGKLIYPRVVGTSIGLPGIWVLAAVTIGAGAAGIVGMLFGVPIAATLYQLLKNSTNYRLEKQTGEEETTET